MKDWLRLRIHDVPLQWHEAVAIVRDVADAIAEGEIWEVPASGSLAVDPEGTVHLLQSVPAREPRVATDAGQVAELGRLLRELLPSSGAPQELVRLASNAGEGPAPATPAEFSAALAFFERPSRDRDLQALAARLGEAQEQHRLKEELESLTRKARADGQPPPPPAAPARRVSDRLNRVRKFLLLGGGGTAIVLAILGLLALGPSPGQSAQSDRAGAGREEKGFLARVRDTARSMLGTSEPPAAAPAAEGAKVSTDSRKRPRRSPPLMRRAIPEPRPVPAELPESVTVGQWEEVAVPVANGTAAASFRDRDAVFDRGDEDVVPAVLVRPHLPTIPQSNGAGEAISALDVVISEDGHVERVRLVATSPERRYYDAMILAAVKAWIFQPASRNGQPVKYRVRIPLT